MFCNYQETWNSF